MLTGAKRPPGSATACQAGRVTVAVSRVQRVSGGVIVTRPVSNIAPTATHVCGKPVHVCVVQDTGEPAVRTSAELVCMGSSAECPARPVVSRTAAITLPGSVTAFLDTSDTTAIKFVQMDTMANTVLKCVLTVPTTPHVTIGTVTVNVYQAGLLLTAPYPVLLDVSVRSALRPAPVRPTSSVTDSLGNVCAKVEEKTVNKSPQSSRAASWCPSPLVRGSRGGP